MYVFTAAGLPGAMFLYANWIMCCFSGSSLRAARVSTAFDALFPIVLTGEELPCGNAQNGPRGPV